MSSELFLLVSEQEIELPYKFKMTNINAFTIEEAAYHCFAYWKQSYDEFLSDEFIYWVKDVLKQTSLLDKINNIKEKKTVSERLMAFLSLFEHFNKTQLDSLKRSLNLWETRMEWERIKEKADFLAENGQPEKAIHLYLKALEYEENSKILNNIGICFMKLSKFKDSINYLEKALKLEENNVSMVLSLAEASVKGHFFEKALKSLKQGEQLSPNNPDIQYLYGELNIKTGNARYSIDYFQKALSMKYDSFYLLKLTDVYIKLCQYDKALSNLENIQDKDKEYLIKQAQVYSLSNNVPAAIKSIEKALLTYRNDVELWTKLAMYHRLDYDLNKAMGAVTKALSLNPHSGKVKLEQARINKAQGKTKQYQSTLNEILNELKNKYRYKGLS